MKSTSIIRANTYRILNHNIEPVINILNQGGIIIYPTDTAYAIGCRIDNQAAVDKLFRIRNRPVTQATPLLVSGISMAEKYFKLPTESVLSLMRTYWPGALTIVYFCQTHRIYAPLRGLGDTVGLRMPDRTDILAIIKAVKVPIVGTSANIHGEPTPFSIKTINPYLIKRADMVISGRSKVKSVSTVIDCTHEPYTILRQGAIRIK